MYKNHYELTYNG